jgi:type IV secretory pathway VirD2 relaxase
MVDKFEFEPRLGAIGRSSSFLGQVLNQAARDGRISRSRAGRRPFDGSRIGRGAGVGRVLRSFHGGIDGPPFACVGSRRTMVLAKTAYNGAGNGRPAAAHLLYLERPGVARDGGPTRLYDQENDTTERRRFVGQTKDDRHHFRIVVSPEDATEYDDLKPFIRKFMAQVSRDLRTDLDWIAADHYDTALPHSHIVVRGRDSDDNDLIIAREYIGYGMPIRAAELLALDLGERDDDTIRRARYSMLREERLTPLDQRFIEARDENGLVSCKHDDLWQQSQRTGRLRVLQGMGLAQPVGQGQWRLTHDLPELLTAMGEQNEQALKTSRNAPEHDAAVSMAVPGQAEQPLIGSVIAVYPPMAGAPGALDLDALDGHIHHVRIDSALMRDVAPTKRAIVAVGLCRVMTSTGLERGAEQDALGLATGEDFSVAPIERAASLELLSASPLEKSADRDGVTWLDQTLMDDPPRALGGGFGAVVARALERRRQWLIDQNLAEEVDGLTTVRHDLLDVLDARALAHAASPLSKTLGLPYAAAAPTDHVDGRGGVPAPVVTVENRSYAIVQTEFAFSLVPWSADGGGHDNGRTSNVRSPVERARAALRIPDVERSL